MAARFWGGLARVRVFSKKLLRCGGAGEEGERAEGRGVRAGREAPGLGKGSWWRRPRRADVGASRAIRVFSKKLLRCEAVGQAGVASGRLRVGVKGELSLASPPPLGAGWREIAWAGFFGRVGVEGWGCAGVAGRGSKGRRERAEKWDRKGTRNERSGRRSRWGRRRWSRGAAVGMWEGL